MNDETTPNIPDEGSKQARGLYHAIQRACESMATAGFDEDAIQSALLSVLVGRVCDNHGEDVAAAWLLDLAAHLQRRFDA